MISGAKMWIIRILGFGFDMVWEFLCMGSGDEAAVFKEQIWFSINM